MTKQRQWLAFVICVMIAAGSFPLIRALVKDGVLTENIPKWKSAMREVEVHPYMAAETFVVVDNEPVQGTALRRVILQRELGAKDRYFSALTERALHKDDKVKVVEVSFVGVEEHPPFRALFVKEPPKEP